RLVNALTPKDGNRYIDGEYFIIHCSNIKLDYLSPITLDKHDGTPSRPIARATVSFTKLGKSKTFPILPSHVGMLQALPAVQTQSSPEGFLLEIVADQPRGPLYCRSIREFQPAFEFMEYRRAKPSAYLTKVAVMDLKTWLNQACKNAADLSVRVDRKAETDWRRLLSYNFKPGRVEYTQNGHRVSRVVPARVWWDTASNVIYSVPDGAEI
ncbi:MAG: hypothetical protein K2Z81_24865, partial [Cyanobacteria bacterium]|nr:hypothetical protein [Cyanobacteriota bacterium]